jgi:hypothetical protein
MPYDIKRNYKDCKGYAVVKEGGEIMGCHLTRNAAQNQQMAIYASESKAKKFQLWKNSPFKTINR